MSIEPFDAVDVIRAKRDGGVVPEPALRWMVDAYTRGYVSDAQMASFAMAVFQRGMERDEIRVLTDAMIASGERMSFASLGKKTVDKHSTGGVGDKITLPLAPLVACFGVAVPQLSGRGLGHTGGTLDKLESIPGWRAALSNEEMFAQMQGDVGAVICAAGSGLAPADKKLYALRDVTGTVEAIPLIASSIMSKKIAEGTDALVLDVKFGSGAFMQDIDRARELARTMVALGTDSGVATALLTDMNTPLGRAIGNANEVRESVEVLAGGGPADVRELTIALAREMLALAGQPDADVERALDDGRDMDSWKAMIRAQDGDPDAPLPTARETHVVTAAADGVVSRMDALPFGVAAWRLGAGRARAEDPVIFEAGIDLHAKPGDRVVAGQPLFTLSAADEARFPRALEALEGSWEIGESAPERTSIVRERITA
ncbi:MAG: thymidine phosphorylase [Microbacterium sp.]|nr:thymidine phosphorylase [Microbacterium sp.]